MHIFFLIIALSGAAFIGLLVGCLCAVAQRADSSLKSAPHQKEQTSLVRQTKIELGLEGSLK